MAEKVTLISDIPVTNDIQDGSKFLLDNSTDGSASVTTMLALKNYILEQLGSSDSIELKDSKFEAKLSEALDNLLEVTADVMSEDGSTIVTKGGLYVGKTVVYITEADYNTLVTDSKVDANKLYVILLTKAQESDPDKFKMVLNGKEISIGSELTGSDSVEIQNDVITARLSEATDNLLKVSVDVMNETGDAVVTKGGLYVGNNLVYITEDDYNALVTDSKVDTEKLYVVILNKTAESDPDKFKLVFNGKEIKIADETSNTIEDLTEAEIIELVDAMDGEYTPQSSILVLNMTSNTTPAPYSASASSIYGGDNNAYYAFNAGTNVPWQTANNTPSAWIQLDMGSRTKITSFSITTRTTIPTSAPKDFILYGSDDGTSYTEIKAFSNQIGWSVGETRNFDLGGVYNYQIYKLDIITNNGYSFTSVQHIKFYKYTENDSDKNGINKYSLREILADSGIGKKANHANREVLDKFSEGTEVGKLLYNGKEIGTGTSTVEKSETNGNIINNGEELVVYDDTELNKNIANLNARSTLGSELTMFEAMLTDAITVTANTNIPYNNILFNNGGFSLSNGVVSGFKAGRTYEIQAGGLIFNTAGRLDTRVKNISTGEYLSNRSLSNSTSIANSVDSTTTGYFKCVSDTESISIEAIYASGTCTIAGGYPYIKITEVGRTVLLDPVKYAQEHEVKVSTFGISAETTANANTPVVFNTVNGNIPLTNNGYVQLEKDVTYIFSASIYNNSQTAIQKGIRIYDVTNGANISYIGVNGHSSGTVKYTATQNIEVSITMATTVQLEPTYTYLTVQEVKNPVVVEYTPNQAVFAKTVLWEGSQVSTGTIELTEEYGNYDFLVIVMGNGTWGWGADRIWFVEYSDNFIADVSDRNNGVSYYFSKVSTSEKQLEIGYIQQTNTTGSWSVQGCPLSKIIGVKGGTTNINLSDAQKASLKEQLGLNEVDATVTTNAITEKVNSLWEVTN